MPELQAVGDDQTAAARGRRVNPADTPLLALLAALLLAAVSAAGTAVWWHRAQRGGWMDLPGHRSNHSRPTPRGGGVGMLATLLLAALLLPWPLALRLGLTASLLLVGLLGLLDDYRGLRPGWKLLGQVLAVLPLAITVAPGLADLLPVAGMVALLLSAGLAACVLLFFVNAWNFMDGIDGIAALSAAMLGLVALLAGSGALAWFGLALAAACAGFLPWNLPRARLFMGDAGSHALGLAVGALLLLALPATGTSVPIAFWALLTASLPFAIDVLATLGRRTLDGEPLAHAHRRHLYQLAVRKGYSHARVALAYAGLGAALGSGVAMIGRAQGEDAAGLALAAATAALALAWSLLRGRLAAGLEGEARA